MNKRQITNKNTKRIAIAAGATAAVLFLTAGFVASRGNDSNNNDKADAPLAQHSRHRFANTVGRTDGHRRFVNNDLFLGHVAPNCGSRRDHMLQIGRSIFIGRGAHRDELRQPKGDRFFLVRCKAQTAGGHVSSHQFQQARLVNWDASIAQNLNFCGVHIKAQDMVAGIGQARAGDQPHVTSPNY